MTKKLANKSAILLPLVFVLVAGLAFVGVWLFSQLFIKPGEVTYDASLTDSEKSFLTNIFTEDTKLKNDVTISAVTKNSPPGDDDDGLIYDILVPIADFYYPGNDIDGASFNTENTDGIPTSTNPDIRLISLSDLTPDHKLLALDGNYFLDTLDSGAYYRVFNLDSKDQTEARELITPHLQVRPTDDTVLSFAQTGVIALSRAMAAKLSQVGDASYFAANIKDFLSSKDYTHTSNEASFSDSATSENICSKPEMLSALTAIGLDVVELTGNHNQDCGDEDAIKTIDIYKDNDIQVFGGGKNAAEAAEPAIIDAKNTKITLLGYNLSTGGYTTDNTPGANFYTTEKAKTDIESAKNNGDFVIVDVQFYECSEYDTASENTACDAPVAGQTELFHEIADLGADIVIGTSAHQPQIYELYHDKPIYYGLGNLFFDQSWWPGTTRSLVLTHYFINGKYTQTRISPTVYDGNFQPTLMDEETSRWFLARLGQSHR
ncbi:CapA family protein [Candidatus Saccharibacteria bacterium]|nr:CapA family protein [Candidatus Saccharibacteria bacterium]